MQPPAVSRPRWEAATCKKKIKQNDTKEGLAAASLLSFLGLFAKLHWVKSNFWDCLSGSWFSRNQLWEGRGTGRLVAAVLL